MRQSRLAAYPSAVTQGTTSRVERAPNGFGGNLIRGDGGSDERFIGAQGEVVLTYEYNRNLNAALSYSRFYPGALIEDTPARRWIFSVWR